MWIVLIGVMICFIILCLKVCMLFNLMVLFVLKNFVRWCKWLNKRLGWMWWWMWFIIILMKWGFWINWYWIVLFFGIINVWMSGVVRLRILFVVWILYWKIVCLLSWLMIWFVFGLKSIKLMFFVGIWWDIIYWCKLSKF